jgi:4-hydroxy-2-oxoheptanedioate aldolase
MLPGSNVSRAMARTGLDWICVDTEHGNIDGTCRNKHILLRLIYTNDNSDGQMHEAVAAIAGCGVSPVVRIAANEAFMVKSMFYQNVPMQDYLLRR